MRIDRTTPSDPRYQRLIIGLDAELAVTDGDEHDFYDQFNGSGDIHHVVILEEEGMPRACGALKAFDGRTVEVKRMYTVRSARGRGLAGHTLDALEFWAAELGYRRLILETGTRQVAAIRLYERHGYRRMAENYAQYAGVANSICFEKEVPGAAAT